MSYQDPETPPPPLGPPPSSKDENMWATLCHLSTFVVFTGIGLAFGNIIAPLVIWLIKKEEMPLVDDQGKEVLNFQISVTIYGVACGALICTGIGAVIGIPLAIVLGIFDVIVTIVGAIKANQGEAYRYPLCIRFIS